MPRPRSRANRRLVITWFTQLEIVAELSSFARLHHLQAIRLNASVAIPVLRTTSNFGCVLPWLKTKHRSYTRWPPKLFGRVQWALTTFGMTCYCTNWVVWCVYCVEVLVGITYVDFNLMSLQNRQLRGQMRNELKHITACSKIRTAAWTIRERTTLLIAQHVHIAFEMLEHHSWPMGSTRSTWSTRNTQVQAQWNQTMELQACCVISKSSIRDLIRLWPVNNWLKSQVKSKSWRSQCHGAVSSVDLVRGTKEVLTFCQPFKDRCGVRCRSCAFSPELARYDKCFNVWYRQVLTSAAVQCWSPLTFAWKARTLAWNPWFKLQQLNEYINKIQ